MKSKYTLAECMKSTDCTWPDAFEIRGMGVDVVCVKLSWYQIARHYSIGVAGAALPHMSRDYSEYDAARQAFDEIVEMDRVTIERLQRMGFSA